ncbi:enoyl-CoA hydratase [Bacillus sp. FJAT-44742]|uniref:enoyl-CoA hydratase n=1 Tax=Bacillus sp. FJAT-44742 TaxID=2014005 RepID=UPI000C24B734|nr:enoyl-CoA hydratase [Bacillus sp. FJAT-44742]
MVQVGDVITFQKSFTTEDVRLFTKVSGDEGSHHIHPDEEGRLIVQGLLTATLPTKVGGEHNVLARNMNFEFIRPVYTNDVIECKVKIEQLSEEEKKYVISSTFSCRNQRNEVVLKGEFSGIIRK